MLTRDGFPVEAVAMRHRGRRTACLSSQSGCPLACTFCATGEMGLGRNLRSGEIVEQLLALARILRDQDATVGNVVMMGMGEPFLNYDAVLDACRTMHDPDGFNLGARHIAISTAGWVPGIERLAEEPLPLRLALSLHAPTDELRSELMPVTRRYPIERLMAACRDYRERTGRRIFVEYLLLDGVNDSDREARTLGRLLGRGPGLPRQPDRVQPDRLRVLRLAPDAGGRVRRDPARARGRSELPALTRERHRGRVRPARGRGRQGPAARSAPYPGPGIGR